MKKNLWKRIYRIFMLLLISFLVYKRAPLYWQEWNMEGKQVQSFSVLNLKGQKVKIPKESKNSIFIFWAWWCGPCKIELSRYRSAVNNGELDSQRIYSVHLGDTQSKVIEEIKKLKLPFKNYHDPGHISSRIFSIAATPTVVHLDEKNKIQWIGSGVSPTSIWRAISHLNNKEP